MKYNGHDTIPLDEVIYVREYPEHCDKEARATETINQLTGTAKKVAKLIMDGYSIREAAKKVLIPESTVRRLLRTAGKQLQEQQTAR